jgi:hypothetical protein
VELGHAQCKYDNREAQRQLGRGARTADQKDLRDGQNEVETSDLD